MPALFQLSAHCSCGPNKVLWETVWPKEKLFFLWEKSTQRGKFKMYVIIYISSFSHWEIRKWSCKHGHICLIRMLYRTFTSLLFPFFPSRFLFPSEFPFVFHSDKCYPALKKHKVSTLDQVSFTLCWNFPVCLSCPLHTFVCTQLPSRRRNNLQTSETYRL